MLSILQHYVLLSVGIPFYFSRSTESGSSKTKQTKEIVAQSIKCWIYCTANYIINYYSLSCIKVGPFSLIL